MAGPDPSVSNGTCFRAANGKKSYGLIIPCGNVALGHVHCCQAGDHCLEESACYNGEYGTTYLAGCTDSTYEDASCPDKKSYRDYPWAGLIYCKFNRWVACEEEDKPFTIEQGDECTCPPDDSMTVAFSAASVIPGIGVLPAAKGGTIEWDSGHLPTPTQSPTMPETTSDPDSSSSITSPPGLTLPIPTNPSTDANQGNNTASGLSTGAIAGIATGASIGAILILGALSALWLVFRRRRRGGDKDNGQDNTPTLPNTVAGPGLGPGSGLPEAGVSKFPAEMPSPEVLPRPAFSELPGGGGGGAGVGPWAARQELLGDVSPPVSPPMSPPMSPPLSPPGSGMSTTGSWGMHSGGDTGGHGQQGYYQGDTGHQGYYMAQGSPGQQPYYMAQGNYGQQPYQTPPGNQGQQSYHMAQDTHGQQPCHMPQGNQGQQPYMAQDTHGQQAYHTPQGEGQERSAPSVEGPRTGQEGQEGASELPG